MDNGGCRLATSLSVLRPQASLPFHTSDLVWPPRGQRQTRLPLTQAQPATGGRCATTAPFGPAQPARYTPRAQTTASASGTNEMNTPSSATAAAAALIVIWNMRFPPWTKISLAQNLSSQLTYVNVPRALSRPAWFGFSREDMPPLLAARTLRETSGTQTPCTAFPALLQARRGKTENPIRRHLSLPGQQLNFDRFLGSAPLLRKRACRQWRSLVWGPRMSAVARGRHMTLAFQGRFRRTPDRDSRTPICGRRATRPLRSVTAYGADRAQNTAARRARSATDHNLISRARERSMVLPHTGGAHEVRRRRAKDRANLASL